MEGFKVYRVPSRKSEWTRHTALELCCFFRSAWRWCRSHAGDLNPDHVLAHFTFPAGEIARRLSVRNGVPYSVVLHGSDVPGYAAWHS